MGRGGPDLPFEGHTHPAFDGDVAPALRVALGERFTLTARSLLTDGAFERSVDYSDLSIPVTGPVAIDGVRAGDLLRVHIHAIDIADRGAMLTLPGRGAFADGLRRTGRIVPIADGAAWFDDLGVPVRPMVGKIGVGVPPPAPGSSTLGDHGGNLDCRHLVAGASVILRVALDGGLLFAGDLHACQGDGESSLTAVEVEGRLTLSCERLAPDSWPFDAPVLIGADGDLLTTGDGADLGEATRTALANMQRLLMDARGWSPEDAAMFLSIAADVGVAQLVNPRVGATVRLPGRYLTGTPLAQLADDTGDHQPVPGAHSAPHPANGGTHV